MSKGIIYVMTTVVPGLIKIGKTGSNNFEQRMYNLEHDGYRNVTALKRAFAIEVEDYDEKEQLLDTIFAKSRVGDTELFAMDINIVIQLLSSFEGNMIYPKSETKDEVFDEATDNGKGKLIPDGKYYFKRKKKSENKCISATAEVQNGCWTIIKGSVLATNENVGMSKKAHVTRSMMPIDESGKLLENFELGECSPSFAGCVVINGAIDGWVEWKTKSGEPVDIYRNRNEKE